MTSFRLFALAKISNRAFVFIFLASLAAAFAVYYPGIGGDFLLDDSTSILENKRLKISDLTTANLYQAAFSGSSGLLKRPISMLSFALNYYFTGLNPFYFKLTNVLIHLANGAGIFFLTYLLFSAYRKFHQPRLTIGHIQLLSCVIAAAWLLHPLALTGVLYTVQRMTSLAAFFSIWGLVLYVFGRTRLYNSTSGIWLILASLLIFWPLAILSKENGVLLPIFMLIIEITIFRFITPTRRGRYFLYTFFGIFVLLPGVAVIGYLLLNPNWVLSGYDAREFSLTERILTEARVIWFYIRLIVLPDISQMGLYHDDISLSRSFFDPPVTIFAVLGIVALAFTAVYGHRRVPILSLGLLFFLAGHTLESTIFALEIAHEHRNYLPSYGILLIMFYYLTYPLRHTRTLLMRRGFAVALIGLFAFGTAVRASYWANPIEHGLAEVENHPQSVRANYQIGRFYAALYERDPAHGSDYYDRARYYFERTSSLRGSATQGLFGLITLNSLAKKPIDPEWLWLLENRLRHETFISSNASWLMFIVKCQAKQICSITKQDMASLFDAALENRSATSRTKAYVLTAASIYYTTLVRDYKVGLGFARQAIQLIPTELQYRFNLISLLITVNKYDTARDELSLVKSLDRFGFYTSQTGDYERLLTKLSAKKPPRRGNSVTIPINVNGH